MGWADAKYMVSAQGITVDNRPQLPGKTRSSQDCDGMPRFHPHEQVFCGPARTPGFTVVTRSETILITCARVMLLYKISFIYTEYNLKIHWARLRPLPQYERNLGCKYLCPDGARATSVGLR